MNKKVAVTVVGLIMIAVAIQSTRADELTRRVEQLTTAVTPKVVKWRRHFHTHPELSNQEKQTAQFIVDRLREMGIDNIKTGVARHGVVALIHGGKPGPTVALRADMDALPIQEQTGLEFASKNNGVMHACGHDAHMAMLLGAAEVLMAMRDEIPGNVKLMFQPAEEGSPVGVSGGAKLMIEEGVLENPKVSAIFGQHVGPTLPCGVIAYRAGGTMAAVDCFKITVTGVQSHGAAPWKGIDPIVTAAHIVTALQTITSRKIDARQPVVVSVGIIKGGTAWNIIPEKVMLEGTVRTHDKQVRRKVAEELKRIVTQTAAAHGASAKVDCRSYGMVLYNDPQLTRRMMPTLQRAVGKGKLVESPPRMGGEDFAWYAAKVPGLYVFLGVEAEAGGPLHDLHTPKMMLNEAALPVGVRTLSLLTLDYLRGETGK
ncbi:MAG: amidohydrolase [Pirellulales bacterium]|nr:amidohydrolase [Pirellulales bacterium]